MITKKKVLAPNYYDHFSCIGGACEDNCCKDWAVHIDKNSYMKYKKIKDKDFMGKMPDCLKRYRGADLSDAKYAEMILDEKSTCKYQREDGFCEIHAKFGPEYLCVICQVYPRLFNFMVPEIPEFSITMSCPEAVRVALFNPEPMAFHLAEREFEIASGVPKGFSRIAGDVKEGVSYKKHAWIIREGCIDIMQNRSRPVNERILFIGIMLNKITGQIFEGEENRVPGTIQLYTGAAGDEKLNGVIDTFQKSEGMRTTMISILFTLCMRYALRGKTSYEPFSKFLMKYIEYNGGKAELGENEAATYLKMDGLAEECAAKNWETLLSQKGYVLENYFVSYMFSELFPFKYHKEGLNPYRHFILLAEQYALMRVLLCCNADPEIGVTEEQLTKTITALSHVNQHSVSPKQIIDSYVSSESDSLAHISFLLR